MQKRPDKENTTKKRRNPLATLTKTEILLWSASVLAIVFAVYLHKANKISVKEIMLA